MNLTIEYAKRPTTLYHTEKIKLLNFLLSISAESVHSHIERIYHTYHGDMLRFAKRRLKQHGIKNYEIDAQDTVQNAFVKITKYINKIDFSESEEKIKAYVLSIVSNEVINTVTDYRYSDDLDEYADILEDEDFVEKINSKESYQKIVSIIKRMDEKYSTALMYHYCYEMSVHEIAQMLDLSENTIYTRLTRGKVILLKNIKEVSHNG